ncbi:MAG: flagellar hook-basal body complex protein FliE, partial [Acinetobacter sp.]|nr:flagellar hook-basal body complex protein FliE [Acinetobacter sp.]
HELVMAMEQAKLSMQMAVEIRNRLIDAYQELTRMQI